MSLLGSEEKTVIRGCLHPHLRLRSRPRCSLLVVVWKVGIARAHIKRSMPPLEFVVEEPLSRLSPGEV